MLFFVTFYCKNLPSKIKGIQHLLYYSKHPNVQSHQLLIFYHICFFCVCIFLGNYLKISCRHPALKLWKLQHTSPMTENSPTFSCVNNTSIVITPNKINSNYFLSNSFLQLSPNILALPRLCKRNKVSFLVDREKYLLQKNTS